MDGERVRTEALALLAARPDITRMQLVRRTNLAQATAMAWLQNSGQREGGPSADGKCAPEFARVLDLIKRGDIFTPGDGSVKVVSIAEGGAAVRRAKVARGEESWYETNTTRRVAKVLDYCYENDEIGLITGHYGSGKTKATEMWVRKNRELDITYAEFDEGSAHSVPYFLQMVGEALGLELNISVFNVWPAFRKICAHLCEQPRLLIFDQCECCSIRVLQVMRQIWDRTHEAGVGIVLLSAPEILARLVSGKSRGLGALQSRVGCWASVYGVSEQEMAAILQKEGISQISDEAFQLWYAAIGGSMRWLMKGIRLLHAQHKGKRVTAETVAGFSAHLMGYVMPRAGLRGKAAAEASGANSRVAGGG